MHFLNCMLPRQQGRGPTLCHLWFLLLVRGRGTPHWYNLLVRRGGNVGRTTALTLLVGPWRLRTALVMLWRWNLLL